MTEQNMYDAGLGKTPANFEALTPLIFLGRAARVYPDYPALIHGPLRQSWAQTANAVAASSPRPCAVAALARGTPSPSSPPMCRPCSRRTSGCP